MEVFLNSYCHPLSAEVSWGSFRVSLMDGAKAGSLNDWERATWPEENRKSKTRRESNPQPPTPPPTPLLLNGTWLRGQGGFAAALRALSVRVNTQRVNMCLLMMLDVISYLFTSNYMNKQRGESFKSGTVIIAKSSKSQSGTFPRKCVSWRSNTNRKPLLSDF